MIHLVSLTQGFADNLPLLGNDFVSLDDMEPNTGAVINQGFQKLAVFKDEKGIVNKFSGTVVLQKNFPDFFRNELEFLFLFELVFSKKMQTTERSFASGFLVFWFCCKETNQKEETHSIFLLIRKGRVLESTTEFFLFIIYFLGMGNSCSLRSHT